MLSRLRRGDTAGLEALLSGGSWQSRPLIERYAPHVAAVAARILPGRPEEWEELTSDVFMAAWDNRKKLRPGRVRAWLTAVARNRAFNRLRTGGQSLPLEERELQKLLRQALSGLDRADRELFVRHYYYGQTVARAAEEMGLNLSTAKTRLRRGRMKLKEYLQEVGYAFEKA